MGNGHTHHPFLSCPHEALDPCPDPWIMYSQSNRKSHSLRVRGPSPMPRSPWMGGPWASPLPLLALTLCPMGMAP